MQNPEFFNANVIKKSFEILKSRYWLFVGISLAAYLISELIFGEWLPDLIFGLFPNSNSNFNLYGFVQFLAFPIDIIQTFMMAKLTEAQARNQEFHLPELLKQSPKILWPIIRLTIILFCWVALPIVLIKIAEVSYRIELLSSIIGWVFILFALFIFSIAQYAILLREQNPWEAIESTKNLTKGYRWKTLGRIILIGLITVIPYMVISRIIHNWDPWLIFLINQVMSVFFINPLRVIAFTVNYLQIEDRYLIKTTASIPPPPQPEVVEPTQS